MVHQHDVAAVLARAAERLAFLDRRRDTVVVIRDIVVHLQRILADRSQSLGQQRQAGACSRMRVHDAHRIGSCLVDAAMDGEAGVIEPAALAVDLAVHIHLHEARRGDLVEHLAIIVDQEGVGLIGDAGGHVGVDQVGPAEMVHHVIQRGELAAGLPLGVGHGWQLQGCGHGHSPFACIPPMRGLATSCGSCGGCATRLADAGGGGYRPSTAAARSWMALE